MDACGRPRYVDAVPGPTLAEVTSRRSAAGGDSLRCALVHLTSSPGSARLVRVIIRLGYGCAAIRFYDVHVGADTTHG